MGLLNGCRGGLSFVTLDVAGSKMSDKFSGPFFQNLKDSSGAFRTHHSQKLEKQCLASLIQSAFGLLVIVSKITTFTVTLILTNYYR